MSLDVWLTNEQSVEVFDGNITHNLTKMAKEAGIYFALWRPEEVFIEKAWELVHPLSKGFRTLCSDPEHFRTLNPTNGWGTYDHFIEFVGNYLLACIAFPDADINVNR